MESIQIAAPLLYDFLASLSILVEKPRQNLWQDWIHTTISRMSVRDWQQVQQFPREAFMDFVPLIPLVGDESSIETLLSFLSTMPIADFLHLVIIPNYTNSTVSMTEEDILELTRDNVSARRFIAEQTSFSGLQRKYVLRALSQPEVTRTDILEIMRRHVECYTTSLVPLIYQDQRDARQYLQEKLRSRLDFPSDWLPESVNLDGFNPIVIVPSAILGKRIFQSYHETDNSLIAARDYEPFIMMIGTQRIYQSYSQSLDNEADRWVNIYEALADTTRMQIIRLMMTRPWYGQEIAQALLISPATVSHHMLVLYKVGIIGIERRSHRTYYVINKTNFSHLLNAGRDFLLTSSSLMSQEQE
jgi:DNA-binding transcriptional ArsR family regulator